MCACCALRMYRRINSPAIVYKTTRNVIPTFENINAVKARQWSFARSNGGFCLRRTERFRSILFPSSTTFDAGTLSNRFPSRTLARFLFHWRTLNSTWYPPKYYFLMYSTHPRQTNGSTMVHTVGRRVGNGTKKLESTSVTFSRLSAHFIFGLNFIVKVFHNQNFMLAPPLSSVGLETVLFGFRMELMSLNLLNLFLSVCWSIRTKEEEIFQLGLWTHKSFIGKCVKLWWKLRSRRHHVPCDGDRLHIRFKLEVWTRFMSRSLVMKKKFDELWCCLSQYCPFVKSVWANEFMLTETQGFDTFIKLLCRQMYEIS